MELFNIRMGSYNGEEICNMIEIFLLNAIKISKLFKNWELSTFPDDGLAVIQSKSPRSA